MDVYADGNSFYCSCGRISSPSLRNRLVVVLSNNDGCIVALTKEAKQIELQRGTPLFKIKGVIGEHGVAVFSSH